MPILRRNLSRLARAEAGLSAKQIRRSIGVLNATKSKVQKETRSALIPDVIVPEPTQPEEPSSEPPPS